MLKSFLLFLTLITTTIAAQAHFVWVEAIPAHDAAKGKIRLSFAENPGEGEPHLAEKIKQSVVTPIAASKQNPVEVTLVKGSEHSNWETSLDAKATGVQANCDYGVITKAGSTFWLNYYAKGLAAPLTEKSSNVEAAAKFQLVTKLVKNEIVLTAIFDGKPVKDQKVTVTVNTDEKVLTTDEQGSVRHDYSAEKPLYAVVGYTIKGEGEHNGKKYDSVKHYATLTIPAAGGKVATTEKTAVIPVSTKKEAATSTAAKISAPQLLADARANRVVWEKFPGFTAKAIVSDNGEKHEGTVTIDAKSNVKIEMADGPAKNWLSRYMNSMAQHRLPDSNEHEDVAYDEDTKPHPLGTKIKLNDDLGSYYRIRDNVVYEVNRSMGKNHFTISVMDIAKNSQGKYLPSIFTFSVWNPEGKLVSTMTEHDRWVELGGFDLPQTVMQVSVDKDKPITRTVEFTDHKLAK